MLTHNTGPYRGYAGRAEYDEEAGHFHGEVLGLTDVITFQAKMAEGLERAFRESVDDYLEMCAKRGEQPQQPTV